MGKCLGNSDFGKGLHEYDFLIFMRRILTSFFSSVGVQMNKIKYA
jgi:hypothetical protein